MGLLEKITTSGELCIPDTQQAVSQPYKERIDKFVGYLERVNNAHRSDATHTMNE